MGGDPVGAFEENRFAVDAEIEAQSCGTDNWFLDQLHGAKIHLQVEILKKESKQYNLNYDLKSRFSAKVCLEAKLNQ